MKDKNRNMKLLVAGGIAGVLGLITIAMIKSNDNYEYDNEGYIDNDDVVTIEANETSSED